jgi:hypothetical protein
MSLQLSTDGSETAPRKDLKRHLVTLVQTSRIRLGLGLVLQPLKGADVPSIVSHFQP